MCKIPRSQNFAIYKSSVSVTQSPKQGLQNVTVKPCFLVVSWRRFLSLSFGCLAGSCVMQLWYKSITPQELWNQKKTKLLQVTEKDYFTEMFFSLLIAGGCSSSGVCVTVQEYLNNSVSDKEPCAECVCVCFTTRLCMTIHKLISSYMQTRLL